MKIEKRVGKNSTNQRKDVATVRELLNRFIDNGSMPEVVRLDESVRGNSETMIHAIRQFQSQVMHVPPTGRVIPGGDVIRALNCEPKNHDQLDYIRSYLDQWGDSGIEGVPNDMLRAAMESYLVHMTNPRFKRHQIVTLVDFRLPRSTARLWVVNVMTRKVLYHCRVAHGKGPKGNREGAVPQRFGQDYASKLGAFITTNHMNTSAGQKNKANKGPGLRIQGLDESNRNSNRIGVMFHGAHYVNGWGVANSKGCFATSFGDNVNVIGHIEGGTFVYSYAGDALKPEP